MKMKKVALQVALLTGFGLAAGAANASLSTGEMIIVHPFQWTYDNIAKECTEVLGPLSTLREPMYGGRYTSLSTSTTLLP